MNILITGGAGYIGSHCAKLLKNNGFRPIVLDNLSRGSVSSVKYGPLVKGDCRDTNLVCETLKDYQIEAVFHLAGYAYVEESVRKPVEYFSNNVGSLLSVLEAMGINGLDSLVFSSSCTVYGNTSEVALEEAPLSPHTPYAKSKAICEKILFEALKNSSIRSVILRFFNVAGCDPEGEIGENHDPETHILPLMLKAALGERKSFEIFGNDYPTEDGTCIRDYIHVSDVADAHLRALTQLKNGGKSKIYNLSQSEGISNFQLAKAVQEITGQPLDIKFGPRRLGDEPILVGNSSLVRKELGWEPKNSSLKQIVKTAYHWELKWLKKRQQSIVAPRQNV